MGVRRYTIEEKAYRIQQRRAELFEKKAKKIIEEMGDGCPHKVEIILTEFYGTNRFIAAPYFTITLLIDGRRMLGGKMNVGGSNSKMKEFIWYGTPNGQKPNDS